VIYAIAGEKYRAASAFMVTQDNRHNGMLVRKKKECVMILITATRDVCCRNQRMWRNPYKDRTGTGVRNTG